MFAVYGTNNRLRRLSAFIETSNSNENTYIAKENEPLPKVINVPCHKQNSAGQRGSSHVSDHLLESCTTQTNAAVLQNTAENFVEFSLDAENDDDLLLQSSLVDNRGNITEPLLFRNNYFKITSQEGDHLSAMCVNCGVDENNQPKTVLKTHKNVSSNFIGGASGDIISKRIE